MGIKGLTKLLAEHAPESIKEREMKAVSGAQHSVVDARV